MSGCPIIGDVCFDHLGNVVSTRFLHCKLPFSLLNVFKENNFTTCPRGGEVYLYPGFNVLFSE